MTHYSTLHAKAVAKGYKKGNWVAYLEEKEIAMALSISACSSLVCKYLENVFPAPQSPITFICVGYSQHECVEEMNAKVQ